MTHSPENNGADFEEELTKVLDRGVATDMLFRAGLEPCTQCFDYRELLPNLAAGQAVLAKLPEA